MCDGVSEYACSPERLFWGIRLTQPQLKELPCETLIPGSLVKRPERFLPTYCSDCAHEKMYVW